jgi:hypothetical protein
MNHYKQKVNRIIEDNGAKHLLLSAAVSGSTLVLVFYLTGQSGSDKR